MKRKEIRCPKCGEYKMIETITGIVQHVWWGGKGDDRILKEETIYPEDDEHSTYKCANCGYSLDNE